MGDSLVFLHVVFGHGVARCFELGKISEISAKNGTLIITRHDVHVYVYAYVYGVHVYMYTYTFETFRDPDFGDWQDFGDFPEKWYLYVRQCKKYTISGFSAKF